MKGTIIEVGGRCTTSNYKALLTTYKSNGCGTKATKWIPEVYFHQSCNTHDLMVSAYRDGLLDCHWLDTHKAFRQNMFKDAEFWCDGELEQVLVKTVATGYFSAVVLAEPVNRIFRKVKQWQSQ